MRPCDARPNQFCRRQQIRQDSIHFIRPAAGQQRDHRLRGCQAEPAQKAFASLASLREIDERMADELHWHPAISIDLLLERKNHEHKIGNRANGFQASGAPGPDLGADVIDDRHAEPFDLRRETKVEVRRVEDNERIGTLGARGGDEAAERRQRSRHLGNGFGQSGDRDVAVVVDDASAGRLELRSAQAGNRQRRIERPQLARERAGIQIAGRFPARQQKADAQEAGRLNSVGSIGELILMALARRSTVCGPTLRDAVKAICTPSTRR